MLQVGELPDPTPGPGEVRVRVRLSGINPGDTKKRRGWLGSSMPYPRVVPHSDAAGVIDNVGESVDGARMGERVWAYGAQSYRAFGTAAQYVVVPESLASTLPAGVSDEVGACLGIPGITAHRAVFGDGPVHRQVVLVHGILGGVGSLAGQLARWGGATVVGTVRATADLTEAEGVGVDHLVALDDADPAAQIRAFAPHGVHRIVEVSLSDNVDLDASVAGMGTVIAAYATGDPRPSLSFWPMLFDNVTIRLLGSDDFPVEARRHAASDLTAAAEAGILAVRTDLPLPLDHIAEAHDRIDAGTRSRILLDVST